MQQQADHSGFTRRSVLMGLGAVVATSALAQGARPAYAAPTTITQRIGRFESRFETWSANNGWEYGAATIAYERDDSFAASGTWSGRLDIDFSQQGRYAGLARTIDKLDVTAVRFQFRGEGINRVTVRLVRDGGEIRSGQKTVSASTGFQEVEVTNFGSAGTPVLGVTKVEIQVWKEHTAATAVKLWIDDVDVDHVVDDPAVQELTTSGPPVLLAGDVDVLPLMVRARFEDDTIRDVTQQATLTTSEAGVAEVDAYGALTVVAAGTTTIGISYAGIEQEFELEVRDPVTLEPASVLEGRLVAGGQEFGFVGYNFDLFMLRFQQKQDWVGLEMAISTLAAWGVTGVRLPTSFGLVQPAPGVFPGDPQWAEEFRSRGMNVRFWDMLEYFLDRAGKHGIRSVIDWHRHPTNPYDYWHGGQPQDQGTGTPGKAIAWLAPSDVESTNLDASDPAHVDAIVTSNRWIAEHFRGNPNILGIEVPFNEPHAAYTSTPANLRRVMEVTARAVKAGDPDRLTFAMSSAYGHDVVAPVGTWQLPSLVDGNGPHHYMPNSPVPTRPDAQDYPSPWMAREADQVFSHAIASLFAPYSTSPGPVYNGEGGSHGWDSFLPDLTADEAGDLMIEAALVQYYAAGAVGHMHWGMWEHHKEFEPFVDALGRQLPRFSPVYSAGPVDLRGARIAVIQNPAAVPIGNAHNWALVPWVKLALDLHLEGFHYLTDDEVMDRLVTQVPAGLEQVEGLTADFDYDAVIIDRRNLDARVRALLEADGLELPVLWVDDMAQLTTGDLEAFLTDAGVHVDRRTEAGVQLVQGPQHLVVYRRVEGNADLTRIYPRIRRDEPFRLIDESGEEIYSGDAAGLEQHGALVTLPTWRSQILRIE